MAWQAKDTKDTEATDVASNFGSVFLSSVISACPELVAAATEGGW